MNQMYSFGFFYYTGEKVIVIMNKNYLEFIKSVAKDNVYIQSRKVKYCGNDG